MFVGDPCDIVSSDNFLNLIGEEKEGVDEDFEENDPRNEFAVRKYSVVPASIEEGMYECMIPSVFLDMI